MDARTLSLIEECKRQEESCLYTSTALFEWMKIMRYWKTVFVILPIVFGALATWPLLGQASGFEWLTGTCALLAGLAPAVYKALDFDVSLDLIAKKAQEYKSLHDRFRQAWRITALGTPDEFKNIFDELMTRMDVARSSNLCIPERFFKKAQTKIKSGHYEFNVDLENKPLANG